MEEALLYVDLKTSRKKVVLCPFPFPNFPLPWFTCVTRYRMYWTRRLSPDLRCSSIHWVRVPGTSTVPAPPLLAVLAARPWPRATVRFAVRCTSCATPAAIFFSVPLTRQILQPIGISRLEWRLTSWLVSVLHYGQCTAYVHCIQCGMWLGFTLETIATCPTEQTTMHSRSEWDPGMALSWVTADRFMCLHTHLLHANEYSSLCVHIVSLTLLKTLETYRADLPILINHFNELLYINITIPDKSWLL